VEYRSLREKIAAEGAERKLRYAKFAVVYDAAVAAGREAGEKAVPTPMMVVEHADLSDDRSAPKRAWHVSEGACGFAWVTVSPATCSFARWLKKNRLAKAAYGGGMSIWISAFGQSVARKEACAAAMATKFREELGVKAYANSRLD